MTNKTNIIAFAQSLSEAFANTSLEKDIAKRDTLTVSIDKAVNTVAHSVVAALGDNPSPEVVAELRAAFIGPMRFPVGEGDPANPERFGAYVRHRSAQMKQALWTEEKNDKGAVVRMLLTVEGEKKRASAASIFSKLVKACNWKTSKPDNRGREFKVLICPCCDSKLNYVPDPADPKPSNKILVEAGSTK